MGCFARRILLLVGLPLCAWAQGGALQVETFEPQPVGSGLLNVSTGRVLPENAFGVDVWTGWSRGALHLTAPEDSDRPDGEVYPDTLRTELVGSYGLLGLAVLAVRVRYHVALGVADLGFAGRSTSDLGGGGLGDLRVVANLNLLDRRLLGPADRFGLGLSVAAYLPTGDEEKFLGEGALRWEPRVAGSYDGPTGLRVAANLAWQIRPESRVGSFVNDDVLRWGLAASHPLGLHALEGMVALHGVLPTADQPDPTDLTQSVDGRPYDVLEVLAGLRYGLPFDVELLVAGGKGLLGGIGEPDFRVVGGLAFGLPVDRGREPSWYVARDTDGDGLDDLADRCPREAENLDGIRDEDGCPEADATVLAGPGPTAASPEEEPAEAAPPPPLPALPPLARREDRDGDGFFDEEDPCPEQTEDFDGFADGDGCPEADADSDGIADAEDRCPLVAEAMNRFEDGDGCPDVGPDEDGDGVGDATDLCPYEAETVNGVRDFDGCPELLTPPPDLVAASNARAQERSIVVDPDDREIAAPPAVLAMVPLVAEPLPVLPPLRPIGDADGDGIQDELDACPYEPEEVDGFADGDGCPDPDDDGDGIVDALDKCRFEAETANGFEDEDGCPDVGIDGDGDGVGDAEDVCPHEAETRNGVRDWDGCPEGDVTAIRAAMTEEAARVAAAAEAARPAPPPPLSDAPVTALPPLERAGDPDRDGLAEVLDLCPEIAEDRDGFQDEDGCPDPDNDGDGLADALDRCPNEAETLNGYNDSDGCPDVEPQAVAGLGGVVEAVRFAIGRDAFLPSSLGILNRVLESLQRNPKLRLRIEGHTSKDGGRIKNLKLSRRRALAIRRWLIKQGIHGSRLSAYGFGEDRPIAPNNTAAGRKKNRRVELHFLEQEAP